uniref:AlNc14C7G964 protein n=1 Tax=Albugo laibachii Nc14 TaxID=890382 RepID=F0W1J6_9STRA|nr:AlNc14C7G964 [Albugo laibachii Nc14]|eukprot:CCA14925.1 AlNc14C7G964 [Albugo laibachii Nc14]
MPSFLTDMMASWMPASKSMETASEARLIDSANSARFHLNNLAITQPKQGFHRQAKFTCPEGIPELPRQFMTGLHAEYNDFDMYAANSYTAAIAVTKMIGQREL